MIGFKIWLVEARQAPLYHSTSIHNVEELLKTNMLRRGWSSDIHPSKDGTIVSLTRDINFAFNWHRISGIVLELDQLRLSQRYKITPFNFFSPHPETYGKPKARGYDDDRRKPSRQYPEDSSLTGKKSFNFENQFEESVHQDIKNLDKYLRKIIIKDYEKMKPILDDQDYPTLLKHPLLYDYKTKRFINQ